MPESAGNDDAFCFATTTYTDGTPPGSAVPPDDTSAKKTKPGLRSLTARASSGPSSSRKLKPNRVCFRSSQFKPDLGPPSSKRQTQSIDEPSQARPARTRKDKPNLSAPPSLAPRQSHPDPVPPRCPRPCRALRPAGRSCVGSSSGGAGTLPPPPSSNRTGGFPASGLPEFLPHNAGTGSQRRVDWALKGWNPSVTRWA